jgi:hypothetical protein
MAYVKAIGSRPCVALACISPRIWDAPESYNSLARLAVQVYHPPIPNRLTLQGACL